MPKNPHCKKCDVEITDKENAIKKTNYYYCNSCGTLIEKERKEYQELYDYIKEIYNLDELTGMMLKQIKDYKEDFRYTYRGMYLSLLYFYELMDNTVKDNVGLGIIPFVYEEAKQHYINQRNVIKSLKNIKEPLVTEKIVYIEKPKENKNYANLQFIDLNNL